MKINANRKRGEKNKSTGKDSHRYGYTTVVVTKTVKICYKHPDYAARILIVQVLLEGTALGNFTVYSEVNTLLFFFFFFPSTYLLSLLLEWEQKK